MLHSKPITLTKKFISAALILLLALSTASCKSSKKTVYIGEDFAEIPSEIENINYELPDESELYVTSKDGAKIDLFSASKDEISSLSEKEFKKSFPSIETKSDIANIAAAVFSEAYPESGAARDGMTVYIRTNTDAMSFICYAYGSDGGKACLAIDSESGEIFMVNYFHD